MSGQSMKGTYLVILVFLVVGTLVTISLRQYDDLSIIEGFRSAYHKGSESYKWKSKKITTNQILFPKSFNEDIDRFISEHADKFDLEGNPDVKQVQEVDHLEALRNKEFKNHTISIFDSTDNINLDLRKCDAKLKQNAHFTIDEVQSLDEDLKVVMMRFLMNAKNDPYFQELAPFFENLEMQINFDVVDKFFYRMAGSSVWLEEYGVYFSISRILYAPKRLRNQPIVSLTYAQLYNKDWKELTNTKLVVPTNRLPEGEDHDESKEQEYSVEQYPKFLPIPFFHDIDDLDNKYYGPEDPRLILVTNERGYKEPLIIFNSHHRKLKHLDDDVDDHIVMTPEFYRSLFMCWPWQKQLGKENTDGVNDKLVANRVYSRIKELQFQGLERSGKQKNWSPFTSFELKSKFGYDKYVYFIYRWANLDVLKCDLSGSCSFAYRLNNKLDPFASVGPFRGGTQLVNVNEALASVEGVPLDQVLPPGREIWLGFARAHIDRCGCGANMYRPNLIVVVKDTVQVERSKKNDEKTRYVTRDIYKLSHVSSSISFDVPMIGWDLSHPRKLCGGPNVLLPNGISNLNVESLQYDQNMKRWDSEDYCTLTLSISDSTVHKINMKGLLNAIMNLQDRSLFFSEPSHWSNIEEVARSKMKLPPTQMNEEAYRNNTMLAIGYDNNNLACALQGSWNFCKAYGEQVDRENPGTSAANEFETPIDEDPKVTAFEQALKLRKIQEDFNQRIQSNATVSKMPGEQ